MASDTGAHRFDRALMRVICPAEIDDGQPAARNDSTYCRSCSSPALAQDLGERIHPCRLLTLAECHREVERRAVAAAKEDREVGC